MDFQYKGSRTNFLKHLSFVYKENKSKLIDFFIKKKCFLTGHEQILL